MPSQLVIYDNAGDNVIGTVGDDFIIGVNGLGSNDDTLNGGDGDDYLQGDSSELAYNGTSNSLVAPFNLDSNLLWTSAENPFFANASIPHTTLFVVADAGQTHFSSVTVGTGETITVDIDFGNAHAIGVSTDTWVELYNSTGTLVATNDDAGSLGAGGAGSASTYDSLLSFTNNTGSGETYTIRFGEYDNGAIGLFDGGETFVANIAVTGHVTAGPSIIGHDVLIGGNGNDTIAGQGGNDLLTGASGNDSLFGGTGDDLLDGGDGVDLADYLDASTGIIIDLTRDDAQNTIGAGIDTLLSIENVGGSAFSDIVLGNSDNNSMTGLAGDDTFLGAGGLDSLDGGAGNDRLYGGGGNDVLVGGAGDDALDGGTGTDTANYAALFASITVDLALTSAQNTGGAGTDTFTGIENIVGSNVADNLSGNNGVNVLTAGSGNDDMFGGDGNDTLVGESGNDIIDGGNGIDIASYASTFGAVTVNLATIGPQNTLGAGTDTLANIENVTGGSGADTLTGNAGINILAGGVNNDSLFGGDGNDTLLGESGNDTLDGQIGNDTASYAGAVSGVVVSLAVAGAQNTLGAGSDTLVSIERLTGSDFADTLTGDGGINVLFGGGGIDILDGSAGDDSLLGSDGYDQLFGGAGNDSLNGGAGLDTASYIASASGVLVNLSVAGAQNTLGAGLDSLTSVERVTGSAFADTLIGSAIANVMSGEGGNDFVDGAAGDDTVLGGSGDDYLIGGAGNDSINGGTGDDTADYASSAAGVTVSTAIAGAQDTGGAGIDTLFSIERLFGSAFDDTLTGNALANTMGGGGGNDVLSGAAGIDSLNGSSGNDTLIGGAGNDDLDGGVGADIYRFNSALSAATNVDSITGYAVADDTMELAQTIFAAAGGLGTLAATAFHTGVAAADASDRIIYNSATGQVFYDADGTGGGAQILFATMTAGLAMSNAEFSIVG